MYSNTGFTNAKREHSQVHVTPYLKQPKHLASTGYFTPAQTPWTVCWKGQAPIMMSVMQEGNTSVSIQPITWQFADRSQPDKVYLVYSAVNQASEI